MKMNNDDRRHKIAVISTETIKPSSPTPSHLTTFKLSLFDNHLYPFYSPFVFFYSAPGSSGSKLPPPRHDDHSNIRFDILKSSLAMALTRFYPLAGRLSKSTEDRTGSIPIIRCNDEGVPFSSATMEEYSSMAQFLSRQPDIDSLHDFLPFPAILIGPPAAVLESSPQIAVRATAFPCGGLAVGVCALHKIIDGHTFADFMKLWSAFSSASGIHEEGAYAQNRAATSLFQAHHDDHEPPTPNFGAREGSNVTRRFVFDGEAILKLKALAKSDWVPNPTRIEAVSGFLWKCAVNATARALSPDGVTAGSVLSVAGMMLDLRPRMKVPWPGYSVGNIFWVALSFYDNNLQRHLLDDGEKTLLPRLVSKLRSSTAKIDKEFVGKLQAEGGDDGRRELLKNLQEMMWKPYDTDAVKSGITTVMPFKMSSTIRAGLYDVDFAGWGKPVWISMAKFPTVMTNTVVLIESPNERFGVEAWISLNEQEMTILEHEPEFRTYVRHNPPVLESCLARL